MQLRDVDRKSQLQSEPKVERRQLVGKAASTARQSRCAARRRTCIRFAVASTAVSGNARYPILAVSKSLPMRFSVPTSSRHCSLLSLKITQTWSLPLPARTTAWSESNCVEHTEKIASEGALNCAIDSNERSSLCFEGRIHSKQLRHCDFNTCALAAAFLTAFWFAGASTHSSASLPSRLALYRPLDSHICVLLLADASASSTASSSTIGGGMFSWVNQATVSLKTPLRALLSIVKLSAQKVTLWGVIKTRQHTEISAKSERSALAESITLEIQPSCNSIFDRRNV